MSDSRLDLSPLPAPQDPFLWMAASLSQSKYPTVAARDEARKLRTWLQTLAERAPWRGNLTNEFRHPGFLLAVSLVATSGSFRHIMRQAIDLVEGEVIRAKTNGTPAAAVQKAREEQAFGIDDP